MPLRVVYPKGQTMTPLVTARDPLDMTQPDSLLVDAKTVSFKVAAADWLKLCVVLVTFTAVQVWVASRYISGMEAKILVAQTAAETAQRTADRAVQNTEAASNLLNNSLIKIAADIGEVKGRLGFTPRP